MPSCTLLYGASSRQTIHHSSVMITSYPDRYCFPCVCDYSRSFASADDYSPGIKLRIHPPAKPIYSHASSQPTRVTITIRTTHTNARFTSIQIYHIICHASYFYAGVVLSAHAFSYGHARLLICLRLHPPSAEPYTSAILITANSSHLQVITHISPQVIIYLIQSLPSRAEPNKQSDSHPHRPSITIVRRQPTCFPYLQVFSYA